MPVPPITPAMSLPVSVERRHLITRISGALLLVDTGSHVSFGRRVITWRGRSLDLSTRRAPYPLTRISSSIGLDLDGLLGADLLLSEALTIDLGAGRLLWGAQAAAPAPTCPLRARMQVPIITVEGFDQPTDFAVDTGAVQTFLTQPLARGLPRAGFIDDFHPSMGPFTTHAVTLTVQVGQTRADLRAAILPRALEPMMEAFDIRGVFGLDLLALAPATLDLPNHHMTPRVACLVGQGS